MKFENRVPQSGKENRKQIRVVAGENIASGEFLADVITADGAAENANSVLNAENLNDLTVKATNIEGTIPLANLPSAVTNAQITVSGNNGITASKSGSTVTVSGNYASQSTRGMVRMYVSGSNLYLYNQ